MAVLQQEQPGTGSHEGEAGAERPFDPVLQEAIRKLWEENGRHEFVFCRKTWKLPGASWINRTSRAGSRGPERLHLISLSVSVIHKILRRNNCKPLAKPTRKKAEYMRCRRPIPGERIRMDTCKTAPNLYRYTAIDDCTRYRVLQIYKKRTAGNTLDFLDRVLEQLPFPVQRIRTDRGMGFFAEKVQRRLMEYGIKFRPSKPGSPHLNGKVERSQKTDLEEFYPTVDLKAADLENLLSEWQHYYNWFRPHSSLGGKSPDERRLELSPVTPFWDGVGKNYHLEKERLRMQNYYDDLCLAKLKQCM